MTPDDAKAYHLIDEVIISRNGKSIKAKSDTEAPTKA
jgi:hypothetical protein